MKHYHMLKVALVIDGYTVRTGKHTYTSAGHLSEKTAAANARNSMGLYPGSVCRVYHV
ncbi:TPA: transcriptional regulator [Streptococcus agalactiae]